MGGVCGCVGVCVCRCVSLCVVVWLWVVVCGCVWLCVWGEAEEEGAISFPFHSWPSVAFQGLSGCGKKAGQVLGANGSRDSEVRVLGAKVWLRV